MELRNIPNENSLAPDFEKEAGNRFSRKMSEIKRSFHPYF